jgi:hypothetical protein
MYGRGKKLVLKGYRPVGRATEPEDGWSNIEPAGPQQSAMLPRRVGDCHERIKSPPKPEQTETPHEL